MKYAPCFADILDDKSGHTVFDLGIRVIRTEDIVGTVDKCGRVNTRFHAVGRRDRKEIFRRRELTDAASSMSHLPPIKTNLYRGKHYIIDGHRRTASAVEIGIEYLDAYVHEYIDDDDPSQLNRAVSQRYFEQETGLTNIRLGSVEGYRTLLDDMRAKMGKITPESARIWRSRTFLPLVGAVGKIKPPPLYPDLSNEEIAAVIIQFYLDFFTEYPEEDSADAVVSTYLFARRLPDRRGFRGPLFRLITRILTGGKSILRRD
ncbi:MAG: ParB N-terminal domain-containing protein [Spirochaetia bacterium]